MVATPGVVFVENPRFAEELLRASFLKAILEELAQAGAAIYRDGVPVDEGDLAASVFGDVQLTEEGYQGRIGATDWKAALVELGTSILEPDGSLRRAVESVGLTFEEAH